jgi:hypothetical protein
MNQRPAWNNKAIDLRSAHAVPPTRLDRSDRETLLDQTGKITIRSQRRYSELFFPFGDGLEKERQMTPSFAELSEYNALRSIESDRRAYLRG